MKYKPFPSVLSLGIEFHGYIIQYAYRHDNVSIYYKVKKDDKQFIMQELFPHAKTHDDTIECEANRIGKMVENILPELKKRYIKGALLWKEKFNQSIFLKVIEVFEDYDTVYCIRENFDGLLLTDYPNPLWHKVEKIVREGLTIIHNEGWSPKGFSSNEIWILDDKIKLVDFSSMRKIDDKFNPDRDFRRLERLLRDNKQ